MTTPRSELSGMSEPNHSPSPYTPTTEEVREAVSEWCWSRRMFRPELSNAGDGREFDRWMARVKADGLRETAAAPPPLPFGYSQAWLLARASRLEEES